MGDTSSDEALGVQDEYDDSDFDFGSEYGVESDDGFDDMGTGDVGASFMTEVELDDLMEESNSKVAEITGVSNDCARALLSHLRWKVDDCISLALDDLPNITKKAGLMLDDSGSANVLGPGPETECVVCMDYGPTLALPCGHAACIDCWAGYAENEIENANSDMSCLGSGCHTVVLNNDLRTLVTDELYQHHLANQRKSFMSFSKCLKWCPVPDCGTIIKCDNGGDVVCRTCNEPFCFKCGFDHAPASCANIKAFRKKNQAESKDALWLANNSKECPSCMTYIQKNGGCNWIRCSKCKYEFCWLCFKPIKHSEIDAAGGSHKCNKFEGEIVVEDGPAGKQRNTEREEQRKLAHFFSRYEAHSNSAKLEEKLLKKHKAEDMSADEEKKALMDARSSALQRMRTARNTLSSSYVFGYYQQWDPKNHAKSIFEDLQHLLENRTEALSAAVEASFVSQNSESGNIDVGECRSKLLNTEAAVATNQKNLVDVCRADLAYSGEFL